MGDMIIFPKFKKHKLSEMKDDKEIYEVAEHYTVQFINLLKNHGVIINTKLYEDATFLREVIVAILMRQAHQKHSIQEIIDDMYIPEIEQQKEV